MDPKLFTRLRAARRSKTLTGAMLAELMDACGRPLLAARWRITPNEVVQMKRTGLEYFITEAKRYQREAGAVRIKEGRA